MYYGCTVNNQSDALPGYQIGQFVSWVKITVVEDAYFKIGAVFYGELQSAVAAVKDGETIEMLHNVTLSGTAELNGSKTYTIDFAGYNLSGDVAMEINDSLLRINAGNVTLKNGVLQNNSNYAVDVRAGARANILSGDYTARAAAVQCWPNSTVIITSGRFRETMSPGDGALSGDGISLAEGSTASVPQWRSASDVTVTAASPVKTVFVGAQNIALVPGPVSTVTFPVTTANIADGSYTALVDNLPSGVTVQGQVTISGNAGTLTLAGDTSITTGSTASLTLTIDGVTSPAFTLTIVFGPQKGDTVYFGAYEQTNDGGDGEPIAWKVLKNAEGKLFLLSEKNLDVRPYHENYEDVTWERSTIRSWLNGYGAGANDGGASGIDYSGDGDSFIGTAFNEAERESIATTSAVNDDKIFLLSLSEVTNTNYGFTGDHNATDTRVAVNTAYVASLPGMDLEGLAGLWWLRSPGGSDSDAALVNSFGSVYTPGYVVNFFAVSARPALNLNFESCFFKSESEKTFSAIPKSSIKPTIMTSALPGGKVGTAYSQQIGATAGSEYSPVWSVASGNLPTGLSLEPDGTIYGTPTAAGTFTFRIRAENAGGSDTKAYTVVIEAATYGGGSNNDDPGNGGGSGQQPGEKQQSDGKQQTSAPPTAIKDIPAANNPVAPGVSAALPESVTFPDGTSADVTWTSGDTSIARIDANGNIVAVGEGRVALTARTADGKTQTITVTIAKPVTAIRTPLTKMYLKNGKPLTPPVCAYSVNPVTKKAETTAKLTWKSSKPKIATVNPATGKITPKKTGKTVITATALNGKAKLKITVYVVKKSTPLKKVTLTKPPKSLKKGKAAILKVKAAPAKATNLKVTFNSSKPKILSVDKAGKLTALKKGKAKITVKIGNRKYTKTITVK
jgi:uncharacterized protein YjdB